MQFLKNLEMIKLCGDFELEARPLAPVSQVMNAWESS